MKNQTITGSRVGGIGPGQKGGHTLELLAARRAAAAPMTYTLAEVRAGTGWPKGVRFAVINPPAN